MYTDSDTCAGMHGYMEGMDEHHVDQKSKLTALLSLNLTPTQSFSLLPHFLATR